MMHIFLFPMGIDINGSVRAPVKCGSNASFHSTTVFKDVRPRAAHASEEQRQRHLERGRRRCRRVRQRQRPGLWRRREIQIRWRPAADRDRQPARGVRGAEHGQQRQQVSQWRVGVGRVNVPRYCWETRTEWDWGGMNQN